MPSSLRREHDCLNNCCKYRRGGVGFSRLHYFKVLEDFPMLSTQSPDRIETHVTVLHSSELSRALSRRTTDHALGFRIPVQLRTIWQGTDGADFLLVIHTQHCSSPRDGLTLFLRRNTHFQPVPFVLYEYVHYCCECNDMKFVTVCSGRQ